MKRNGWRASLALLAAAVLAPAAAAAEPAGVNQAIDRGVAYLKGQQRADGTWPRGEIGATALAGLALLECQVPAGDPTVRKAADAVRKASVTLTHTYSLSLCLLFLDRLGDPADVPLIESLAVRLLAGQNTAGGWHYSCPEVPATEAERLNTLLRQREISASRTEPTEPVRVKRTERDLPETIQEQLRLLDRPGAQPAYVKAEDDDNSNTQFATVALWVARRHGLPIEQAAARLDRRFRISQNPDGGWGYRFHWPASASGGGGGRPASTPPMTCAGLLGLAVAHGVADEAAAPVAAPAKPRPDPTKDRAVRAALLALSTALGHPVGGKGNRPVPLLPAGGKHCYFFWAVERVATAYGLETVGKKDWYAWGAETLVASQQADGSWPGEYSAGGVDTCFALLFLKRANLARDLTATLKGKVPDPGDVMLRSGGVGGEGLSSPTRSHLPVENAQPEPVRTKPRDAEAGLGPQRAADSEAARLSDDLVGAPGTQQDDLLARYERSKGAVYTDALAAAIPRLTGTAKARARDALTDRLARMTSRTLEDKLGDDNLEVRRAAALACCMKDDRGQIPRLIALLEDGETPVARAAHAALKGLTKEDFGPAADASGAEVARAVAAWKDWWSRQGGR
jgi:hypothetical protein